MEAPEAGELALGLAARGEYDRALGALVRKVTRDPADIHTAGETQADVGHVYLLMSKPAEALGYLRAACRYAFRHAPRRRVPYLIHLARAYRARSDFARALAIDRFALRLVGREGSRIRSAWVQMGLGLDHLGLSEAATAVVHFEAAVAAFDALGDPAGSDALNNWACACLELEQFDEAEKLARRALTFPGGQRPTLLSTLAEALIRQGKHDEAETLLKEIRTLLTGKANKQEAAHVLRMEAEIAVGRGEHDAAPRKLGEALAIYQQLGLHSMTAVIAADLYRITKERRG